MFFSDRFYFDYTIFERGVKYMTEEEAIELLKFLMTDYGRGYLAGLVSGLSMFLKILKKQSKCPAFIKLFW